jgi:hypothetical protein
MIMATYKVNWPIKGLLKPGQTLQPGQIITLDEAAAKRSLEVGSLSVCDAAPDKAKESQPADLSGMSKAQLVEYAQATLGLALDVNKKKDDLLAAIAEAAGR